jgi:hypothetical protein
VRVANESLPQLVKFVVRDLCHHRRQFVTSTPEDSSHSLSARRHNFREQMRQWDSGPRSDGDTYWRSRQKRKG